MALLLGRATTPEGLTPPGIASNCNNYVTISEGESCTGIADQAGVTLEQFYQWNPSLQDSCAGLQVGYSYCVGVLEATTTASITVQKTVYSSTSIPTTQPPASGTAKTLSTSTSTTPSQSPVPTDSKEAITSKLFWEVHQEDGECQSATAMSLWLISLWIFPCLWTLILGSRDFQKWFRKATRTLLDKKPIERQFISVLGSAALQVSMTVVTAILLQGSVPEGAYPPHLWRIIMAWFIRPLPATAVSAISFISPSLYIRSASIQHIAEAVYGLIAIGPYAVLARHMSPTDYLSKALPAGSVRMGYRLLQGGAIAGAAFWCLCLLLGGWGGMSVWRRNKEKPNKKFYYVALSSAVFNMTRVVAGFLIWNGAMILDPESFCVDGRIMGNITALWAVVPVVDLLIQAMLS